MESIEESMFAQSSRDCSLLPANFVLHSLPRRDARGGSSGESKSGNCQEEAAATLRAMAASRRLPP